MNAVVIANGEFSPDASLALLWQRADLRVAADGGARNARAYLRAVPHVVIGDLDSLDPETRDWVAENNGEFIQRPVAKDETDLELGLLLARERGADRIAVLGALGGRVDQSAANLLLLSCWPEVVLRGPGAEMWAARRQAGIDGEAGDTVSLVAIDEKVEGIVTRNLLYPLHGETLERGATRGVSNVMTARQASVEWENGLLLIVHLSPEQ